MSAGSQLNWDAKNIPQAIKQWLGTETLDVRNGFNTAVENLAGHNDDLAMFTGDGAGRLNDKRPALPLIICKRQLRTLGEPVQGKWLVK